MRACSASWHTLLHLQPVLDEMNSFQHVLIAYDRMSQGMITGSCQAGGYGAAVFGLLPPKGKRRISSGVVRIVPVW